jgi:ferredoxin
MKIAIDRNKCRGVRNCASIAPDVLTSTGRSAVILDPKGDSDETILSVAKFCPSRRSSSIMKKAGRELP